MKTLSVLEDTEGSIQRRLGLKIDWDILPEDDSKVFEMLSEGDTFGVFQLTERGMCDFVKRFKPKSIDDIAIISSLYRPGPLDCGMCDEILAIRSGERVAQYPIPKIKPILEKTNGVLTYQEQVMAIAQSLAGYSLSEADLLRRAMGKKNVDEMKAHRKRFVGAATEHCPEKAASDLFDTLTTYSEYCFNSAHAIAYSILSYRTAYLKCHYPADFLAACMSNEDALDNVRPFINDARKHYIDLACPDVNLSGGSFTAIDPWNITFGLKAVRGCGESAIGDILIKRQDGAFANLVDLCLRIDPSVTKKNNLVALAQGGGFDKLEPEMNRSEIIEYIPTVMEAVKKDQTSQKKNQMTMFGSLFDDVNQGIVISRPKCPYVKESLLELEKESLGLYLSMDPLDDFGILRELRTIDDIAGLDIADLYVTVLARVVSVDVLNTKKGRVGFITLEDKTGVIVAKMWSNVFSKYEGLISPGACLIFSGKTNFFRGLEINIDFCSSAKNELDRVSQPLILKNLSPMILGRLTIVERGVRPVDLEIGDFRFRLGHMNLSPDLLRGLG